jgi:hypothetical protein
MARWRLLVFTGILGGSLVQPTVAAAEVAPLDEVTAYVWANDASAASYHPDSRYSFNSAGGPVTIHRAGPGVYTVVFGGAAAEGGVVHVQTYGSRPDIACTVAGWGPTIIPATDLQVRVRCHAAPNTPADSRFVASFTNAELSGTGRLTYLWADQARPVGVRTLTHAYRYDSRGGPLSYERIGIGEYRIHLPPGPPELASVFPMVHVTPYATEWVACEIGFTEPLIVRCSRADGDPVDTRFTLTYGRKVDLTGHPLGPFGSGVVYEGLVGAPDAYLSSVPAGGGLSGRVLDTGSYELTMRGVGSDGGHVMVTQVGELMPLGPPRGKCSVVRWWRVGADERIQVACHGFGAAFAPRDLHVRVTYTRYLGPPA